MSESARGTPGSGVVILAAALLLGLTVFITVIRRPATSSNSGPELQSAISNYVDAVERSPNGVQSAAAGKAIERMKAAGEQMNGTEAALNAAISRTFERIRQGNLTYLELVAQATSEQTFDIMKLRHLTDLRQRRQTLTNLIAENRRLSQLIRDTPGIYEAELQKAGVKTNFIANALADFNRGFERSSGMMLEIRQTDEDMVQAALSLLDLLEPRTNDWSFDTNRGQLTVGPVQLRSALNTGLTKIQELNARQRQLQQQLDPPPVSQ